MEGVVTKGAKAKARAAGRNEPYPGHRGNAPSYPSVVDEQLATIDPDYHLRWNPRAAMRGTPRHDDLGRCHVEWEGRYEVWGRDVHGIWYHILTVEDGYGGPYLEPGQRTIDEVKRIHHTNWGEGGLDGFIDREVDQPNEKREASMNRDSDNAITDGVKWAGQVHTPKSGRYIRNRGDRLFSGGFGGLQGLVRAKPRIHRPRGGYF